MLASLEFSYLVLAACAHASLTPPQLFIDTVPLGAHTVAMDCLALGTPLVAVAGKLYAHRVSSSILAAAGALNVGMQLCILKFVLMMPGCRTELSRRPERGRFVCRTRCSAVSALTRAMCQICVGLAPAGQPAAAASA